MSRAILIIAALFMIATSAHSDGIGSNFIGRDDAGGISFSGKATAPPPIAGALLLEDGSSILLLEDGTSNLCLEGGC